MRAKRKIFGLAVLLSVLLSVSLVFGLGIIDVSNLPFGTKSSTAGGDLGSTVFMDPVKIIDETKQNGSFVSFHVNISDATDLFTWQLNVSWNPSVLSVSDINASDFLLGTTSPDKTAAYQLGYVINETDNAEGYICMSESILGDVTGESGNGRLVSIEFEVVGYGSTDLTISLTGTLPTTMLDSTGGTITYDTTDGYFRNKYPGDVDGDKYVGSADAGVLNGAYGTWRGDPLYVRQADFDDDGYIGSADAGILNGNYGITFP